MSDPEAGDWVDPGDDDVTLNGVRWAPENLIARLATANPQV
jgi:hypothetical protein